MEIILSERHSCFRDRTRSAGAPSGDKRRCDDVCDRPLRTRFVVFIPIYEHRRERSVSREHTNSVEPDSRLLPFLDRSGDGRMAQRMRPNMKPDRLAEHAHDPQDAPRLEATVAALAAVSARLEQWARGRSAIGEVASDCGDNRLPSSHAILRPRWGPDSPDLQ